MTTVLEAARERTVSRPLSPPVIAGVVFVWITVTLRVDSGSTLTTQRLLGVATWCLLLLVMARESPLVRAQTLVVIGFATLVEYTSSPLLGVYVYRFDNVPAYVPPGHGLVYLAALSFGRSTLVRTHLRALAAAVLLVGGCWAAYGITLADRTDALGAFWFVCLAGFLLWGPSRGLYVGAFVVVSYLEIVGTSLGTWTWQPSDPTGLVAIGNPPSGAAGGYGWFDLAALLLGPVLLAAWGSLSARRRRTALRPAADAEP